VDSKNEKTSSVNRREFIQGALAGATVLAATNGQALADSPEQAVVIAQIAAQHDATVKILQDWIALPSIAAENRNYPQGPEYMAQLARDAGFQQVEVKIASHRIRKRMTPKRLSSNWLSKVDWLKASHMSPNILRTAEVMFWKAWSTWGE